MLRDVFNFGTWKHQNVAFPETSSVKNAASLRDVLNFRSLQHQKRSNSARFSIMEECRADGLVPMRFAIFPVHVSKVLCLPRKSEARPYEMLHLSRRINTPEDLMLQNATPLRKSALRPPNISDEPCLSCLLYCACHAACIFADPLQVSHACQRFWNCHKTLTSCSLQDAESLAPATQNHTVTSKRGPRHSETLRNF